MYQNGIMETPDSIDWHCFQILAYEFEADDVAEAERKIKAMFRRKKLGIYDQTKVDRLRQLKNQLQKEIGLFGKSQYYRGPKSTTAGFEDFDIDRMVADYQPRYAEFSGKDMVAMVSFAVYAYYLR
jgi:hypothetical protein